MSNRDFGGLVRRSRERLGLSQTRLGELVGRAASTIRAWERGQAVPTDPTAVSSLAAVLGLDEPQLFALAGLDPPLVIEDHPTIEQSLREIAPLEPLAAPASPPVQESLLDHRSTPEVSDSGTSILPDGEPPGEEWDRVSEADPEPRPSLDAILADLEAPVEVLSSPAPEVAPNSTPHHQELPVAEAPAPALFDPPPSGSDLSDDLPPAVDASAGAGLATGASALGAAADPGGVRRRDLRNGQAPTSRVAPVLDRLRDLTVRWRNRPRRSRPPAPVGIASAPSYLEIPEEKVVYLRRRVYTAVAVVVALLLAIWSYGAAKTALAETIDLLLSGL